MKINYQVGYLWKCFINTHDITCTKKTNESNWKSRKNICDKTKRKLGNMDKCTKRPNVIHRWLRHPEEAHMHEKQDHQNNKNTREEKSWITSTSKLKRRGSWDGMDNAQKMAHLNEVSKSSSNSLTSTRNLTLSTTRKVNSFLPAVNRQ